MKYLNPLNYQETLLSNGKLIEIDVLFSTSFEVTLLEILESFELSGNLLSNGKLIEIDVLFSTSFEVSLLEVYIESSELSGNLNPLNYQAIYYQMAN